MTFQANQTTDDVDMLPQSLIAQARSLHSLGVRAYHGWDHVEALLALLDEARPRLADPAAVECAILFHDAVYDPARADNERASAALARKTLAAHVAPATLERAVRMIEATERHAIPEGLPADEAPDMAVFLDMDLAILAAPAEAFDAYEAGIRTEYRRVPDAAFREGRLRILEAFLARDRLYLSAWGARRFEAAARANLARSIARLRAGTPSTR